MQIAVIQQFDKITSDMKTVASRILLCQENCSHWHSLTLAECLQRSSRRYEYSQTISNVFQCKTGLFLLLLLSQCSRNLILYLQLETCLFIVQEFILLWKWDHFYFLLKIRGVVACWHCFPYSPCYFWYVLDDFLFIYVLKCFKMFSYIFYY